MINKLYNKKILFFSPKFFNYDVEIRKCFEDMGAIVFHYDDRPSNDSLTKIMIRLSPKLLKNQIHNYYKNIINMHKNDNIDYVFFIKCESPLKNDLAMLKKQFSNAKFYLYLWDSIANIKYFNEKKKYFDKIFSFDSQDVKIHNDIFFRPLFYLDEYKKNNQISQKFVYDISFIGTAHSDRPRIINEIRKQLDKNDKNYYFKLYVPNRLLLLFKYCSNKHFRELYKENYITENKLSSKKISDIINKSNAVIDIQHPKQTGLTMRTIELLGMNKKIITTNQYIKDYDFFINQNICIIDRLSPKIDLKIFDNEYQNIDKKVYDKYSLSNWINEIFEVKL